MNLVSFLLLAAPNERSFAAFVFRITPLTEESNCDRGTVTGGTVLLCDRGDGSFVTFFFRFQAIVLSIVFPNFAVSKNITSCQDDNDKRAKPAFTTS